MRSPNAMRRSMGILGYVTSNTLENRYRKGLLCRSFPVNGSFVLFNLVGSLLKQLFGLVVLLRPSSLLVSPLFLLEREYISNEVFHASTDGRTCNGEGRSRK